MLLRYASGAPFASGSVRYNNAPGTERSTRIIIDVIFGGQLTVAVVDTGIPCSVCDLEFGKFIGLRPTDPASSEEWAIVRGVKVRGRRYNVDVTILADSGDYLPMNIPVLIPERADDITPELSERPHLGMQGCLGSMTFAVDAVSETFYFG